MVRLRLPLGSVHEQPRLTRWPFVERGSLSKRSGSDGLARQHKHGSGAQSKGGAAQTHAASYMRFGVEHGEMETKREGS